MMRKICILSVFIVSFVQAQTDDMFDRTVQLSRQRGTTYEILNNISDITGYMFMYESKAINSNRIVKIPAGTYTLKEVIILATDDQNINTKVFGNHILLYKKTEDDNLSKTAPSPTLPYSSNTYIALEGSVKERETGEPVAFCTIGLSETVTGTIANQDGKFLLKIPDSLKNSYIHFSHLGYRTQTVPASLLAENRADIFLETHIIPFETLIVRMTNPQKLIKDMLNAIASNYYDEPHYITAFYREGVNHKRGFSSLSEGVFQIFKTGYSDNHTDQVKMIKMRTICNQHENDSVVMKMKAGLNACLMLDIIKNLPNFLSLDDKNMYRYTKTGMSMTDERLAHVIAFEQKSEINWPLYRGELHIDAENHALLHARFQIHPDFIRQSAEMLVVKRSRNIEITPLEAVYSVTYKNLNGKYFINHTRGDLAFKIKKKKIKGGTSTIYAWFEMASCKIDTLNVKRFSVREIQSTKNILSETKYVYDAAFWENFNIIPPEEKLNDAILQITSKIELTVKNEE